MKTRKKGALGEQIAALYLFLKGYKILDRNFYVKGGEIDIVAEKNNEIAVVEVKTRKDDKYGTPKEAVNFNKQKHIIYAAKCYINRNHIYNKKIRFDVIEVYLPFFKINHIKHAFEIF